MTPVVRFGTLGAARITPAALIAPCAQDVRAQVHCVAARDRTRADAFAHKHGVAVVHASYDDVVDDPDVTAVYVPLPITDHHVWTIRALEAGKHVLCEKSFASNAREAQEMADVARATGLVLMDAFHYRYHPVFMRARQIVASGMLGSVRTVEARFDVPIVDAKDIRMIYETGGGVTMDIGCYPISWCRHITGEEPDAVAAQAVEGPPKVDTFLKASFRFPSGIVATASADMREGVKFHASLKVTGDRGEMYVRNPLAPQAGHRIDLDVGGRKTSEELDRRPTYSYQLDAFIDAVEHGAPLLTGAEDAVKQMRVIDRCYAAAGLPLRGLQ
ncbi:MAG: Gfo/Idh/MocA family oxidoreductase [Gammaproteobacteria bacterium]|nr:Gfo/Idh/MocA family oxidoreductase [Gammaproteobacteria bacterium]